MPGYLSPGFSSNAGQWSPVAANTSALGMSRVLMPKTEQERG